MKRILYTALICCGCLLTPSCVGDLDQFPHTETTSENIYNSVDSYYQVLAKIYTAMVTTGREQSGSEDLSSNKGFDYMRCYFNLQEVGTDEVAYTWLSGETLTDISNLSWDATDVWVSDMYYRIYYNIALCNEFLRHATDDAIASFSGEEQLRCALTVPKRVSSVPCSIIMRLISSVTFRLFLKTTLVGATFLRVIQPNKYSNLSNRS